MTIKVFISSVQTEFAEARRMLVDYIRQDALLCKFFEPFIFEELPAIDITAPQAYIREAKSCDIYLGIYGANYGYEDIEGISPTEREYDAAKENGSYRMIFIKQVSERQEKEAAFIHKVEQDVVRRSFTDNDELRSAVYAALVRYLEEKDYLHILPWDATCHRTATLDNIDERKVERFVNLAREKRSFPLSMADGKEEILRHLDLMSDDGRLTNAALLLFAKRPQHFFITSQVKCAQFYGTEMTKPIPYMQIFEGNIFELIDQAVAFVIGHVDVSVSGRDNGPEADIRAELPIKAVTEAIVNAVVHRDYNSNGSVQVMLFRDRLEVWNPGHLPYGITPEMLYSTHRSIPRNPILAKPAYLAGYIEQMGTGTTDVIDRCRDWGLKDPAFIQREDFTTIIWRPSSGVLKENGQLNGALDGQLNGGLNNIKSTEHQPDGVIVDQSNGALNGQLNGALNGQLKSVIVQMRALLYIATHEGIQAKSISEDLMVPYRTLIKHIDALTSKGYIVRKGSKKTGGYFLTTVGEATIGKK